MNKCVLENELRQMTKAWTCRIFLRHQRELKESKLPLYFKHLQTCFMLLRVTFTNPLDVKVELHYVLVYDQN